MTTTQTTAAELNTGDEILYPVQRRNGACEGEPRTIGSIVEYPQSRVFYFREGGYGVVDRRAVITTLATT